MKHILIITAMASIGSLSGCHSVGRYQHDTSKVEVYFKACMNSSPSAASAVEFENKVKGCETTAFAADQERFVKL